jgi:hypothetical protein
VYVLLYRCPTISRRVTQFLHANCIEDRGISRVTDLRTDTAALVGSDERKKRVSGEAAVLGNNWARPWDAGLVPIQHCL